MQKAKPTGRRYNLYLAEDRKKGKISIEHTNVFFRVLCKAKGVSQLCRKMPSNRSVVNAQK